jgi:hypothetical protein
MNWTNALGHLQDKEVSLESHAVSLINAGIEWLPTLRERPQTKLGKYSSSFSKTICSKDDLFLLSLLGILALLNSGSDNC